MSIAEFYSLSGVTVGTSELSIVSGTTTLQSKTDKGCYGAFIDASNMAKGDIFAVALYDKVKPSGGTKRLIFKQILSGAQSGLIKLHDLMLYNGWDMTIQKIAGTDRAFDASIRGISNAALTEPYTMSAVTIGSTEYSIVAASTTLTASSSVGQYQLFIDAAAMAKGDAYQIKIYETARVSGTKRELYTARMENAQATIFVTPPIVLMNGWDMTIQKISGTDRAFDASIRKVA